MNQILLDVNGTMYDCVNVTADYFEFIVNHFGVYDESGSINYVLEYMRENEYDERMV